MVTQKSNSQAVANLRNSIWTLECIFYVLFFLGRRHSFLIIFPCRLLLKSVCISKYHVTWRDPLRIKLKKYTVNKPVYMSVYTHTNTHTQSSNPIIYETRINRNTEEQGSCCKKFAQRQQNRIIQTLLGPSHIPLSLLFSHTCHLSSTFTWRDLMHEDLILSDNTRLFLRIPNIS